MSLLLASCLAVVMVFTAFLSGVFGMAGGMVLMGVLLTLMPLPEAMALHAITQMTSNGWRGMLWIHHVQWRPAAAFLGGCAVAFVIWSLLHIIPSKAVTLLLLGTTPFLIRLLPKSWKPDPYNPRHGLMAGSASMILMLIAGVSGPLIDTYFLSGNLNRRQIIATKAVCQICCHAAKLLFFGGMAAQTDLLTPWMFGLAILATITGTSIAKPVLEKLSDAQYRTWANHIITAIACVYIVQGLYQLFFH